MTTATGSVVAVRSSVVDVRFDSTLPPIRSLLRTGPKGSIAIEVLAQLDAHRVRGIALTTTQGLARGRPSKTPGRRCRRRSAAASCRAGSMCPGVRSTARRPPTTRSGVRFIASRRR